MDMHGIDPRRDEAAARGPSGDTAPEMLADLAGLHHLAVRAEELARAIGMHGATVLDDHDRSALEQARSNARAIVASLDRAI